MRQSAKPEFCYIEVYWGFYSFFMSTDWSPVRVDRAYVDRVTWPHF